MTTDRTYEIKEDRKAKTYTWQIINTTTNEIEYELVEIKKKKKRSVARGCFTFLVVIASMFVDGELDFSGSSKHSGKFDLKNKNGDSLFTCTRKKAMRDGKETGKLKAEKWETVMKYKLIFQKEVLGRVIPDSISHDQITVEKEGKQLALFQREQSFNFKENPRTITISKNVAEEDIPKLLLVLMLWI